MKTETIENEHAKINENPKRIVSFANISQGYSAKVVDAHIARHSYGMVNMVEC